MKALADLRHDKYGMKALFHTVMGVVLFVAGVFAASLPVDLFYAITQWKVSPLMIFIRPALEIIVIWLLVRWYIGKVLKLPLREFRICKPKSFLLWSVCAFALPAVVSAFFIFFTPGSFTASDFDTARNIDIILRAVLNSCLTAGITEELIFRGFIMHMLEMRWKKPVAVVAPSVLFGLLHIFSMENPTAADILMLLIAGSAVGIMFSAIAVHSGSVWASAMVHGVWNLVIIGGILGISPEPASAIFNYRLTSDSTLLTGGSFGIEASVPAIVAYGAVIAIAFAFMRRQREYHL